MKLRREVLEDRIARRRVKLAELGMRLVLGQVERAGYTSEVVLRSVITQHEHAIRRMEGMIANLQEGALQ